MKQTLIRLSQTYVTALRAHLKPGVRRSLQPARVLGRQAVALGLETLGLARIHEYALSTLNLSSQSNGLIKRAELFFTEAITPIVETHRAARQSQTDLNRLKETLGLRTLELAAANRQLRRGIRRRKSDEVALKKCGIDYARLLKSSLQVQEGLRQLTHQVLMAQEEERKKISHELQDEVVQTLLGINVRLLSLKQKSQVNTKGLKEEIASTQRLVAASAKSVHQFARELRPAVLDDLGLIPALHSFMKNFTARTGVRTHLTAFAEVEQLEMARRTVLFRVAQEALTNVARHAQASRVEVNIQKRLDGVCLEIKDDGRSFQAERTLHANGGKRLGLLGMRERVEMVGGGFGIQSAPERGTTIMAQMPFGKIRRRNKSTGNSFESRLETL
jgi:signal transduction histidine kinase